MYNNRFRHITIVAISAFWIIVGASLLIPKPGARSHVRDGRRKLKEQHLLRGESSSRYHGRPQTIRALAGDEDSVARQGKCSPDLPYANLEWEPEWKSNGTALSVQEVLIRLDRPVFVFPPSQNGGVDYGPVIVDIGLYINQINEVRTGYDSYVMEGFIDMVWCDSRLKFDIDPNRPEQREHVYLEVDAERELEKIWWPDITFVNEEGKREIENQELIIDADGTVHYRERFAVQLNSPFETRKFPFDSQILTVEIESFAWNNRTLRFVEETDLIGFDEEFNIPEFFKTGIRADIVEAKEPRDPNHFSELIVQLNIQRDPVYYSTKVIIPVILIVAVSWVVFWMEAEELGERMSISFTGILTAVAYQYIVSDKLPDHVYDTFLDNFIIVSFINLGLSVIINVVVNKGHAHGFVHESKAVDKICRVLFPVLYFLGLLMISVGVLADGTGSIILLTLASLTMLLAVGFVMFYFFGLKRRARRSAAALAAVTAASSPKSGDKPAARIGGDGPAGQPNSNGVGNDPSIPHPPSGIDTDKND